MSALLLLSTVLTAQIPTQAVEATWGTLMRATKLAGEWSVTTGDHTYRGNWIVIDDHVTTTRFGTQRWAHLVSSRNTDACAIALDAPGKLRCEHAGQIEDLTVPATLDLARVAATVSRSVCEHGSCRMIDVGKVTTDVKPTRIGGDTAAGLYESIHHLSLERSLHATRVTSRSLGLQMPYEMITRLPGTDTRLTMLGNTNYAEEVIVGEAVIYFGYTPEAQIEIREVDRYVQDCTVFLGGCSMPMPYCTRRSTAPAVIPGDAKLPPTPATARR
ncbi:MAG: hypothetical protein ABI867_18360 [Kofleriaceae bacterium]